MSAVVPRSWWFCALLLPLLSAMPAQAAGEGPRFDLEEWLRRVDAEVEALIAANRRVPPTPVELQWRPERIWSGALGGDVLDMRATRLSRGDKDELVILSPESVWVLSRHRGLFDIRSRSTLPSVPASIRPRDAIGMLSVAEATSPDGTQETQLRIRGSEQGAGGVYAWRDGALELVSEFLGYPICETGTIQAAPGRNYFQGGSTSWTGEPEAVFLDDLYAARCTRGMVDSDGAPVRYMTDVSLAGELTVRCEGSSKACLLPKAEYAGVGYAHIIADLNNDGYAEIVTSSSSARGSSDRLQVYSQGNGAPKLIYERELAHGVMALAAGDFDGDGALELVVAQRQKEPGKVVLWRMN